MWGLYPRRDKSETGQMKRAGALSGVTPERILFDQLLLRLYREHITSPGEGRKVVASSHYPRAVAGFAIITVTLIAWRAGATVLTFDIAGAGQGSPIPQTYGD